MSRESEAGVLHGGGGVTIIKRVAFFGHACQNSCSSLGETNRERTVCEKRQREKRQTSGNATKRCVLHSGHQSNTYSNPQRARARFFETRATQSVSCVTALLHASAEIADDEEEPLLLDGLLRR